MRITRGGGIGGGGGGGGGTGENWEIEILPHSQWTDPHVYVECDFVVRGL